MLKGIKIRIYPTKEQEIYISQLLGCCRLIYNETVRFYGEKFKETGRAPRISEAYANFKKLKEDKPFLKEVHSKPVHEAFLIAISAYTNFFHSMYSDKLRNGKLKFEEPKIHTKHKHDSCLFPKQAFRYVRGNRISLVKKLSNILFKCSREDEIYLNKHSKRIRSITLRRKGSGKYICSVLVEDIRIKELPNATKGDVGIDLGIKHAVITSDGEKVENPKIFDKHYARLALYDRRMNRCSIGSRRFEKARKKLAKAHEKIANVRDNFQHKVSSRLVKEYSGVFTESLLCDELVHTLYAKRMFSDMAMRAFVDKVEYKCKWYGRKFAKVSQFFPSSKRCSKCGYVRPLMRLKEREWICPQCGVHHDRDINAAKNILDEGERIYKVGLGSPEPNARGHVLVSERMADMDESRKESSITVSSVATEP